MKLILVKLYRESQTTNMEIFSVSCDNILINFLLNNFKNFKTLEQRNLLNTVNTKTLWNSLIKYLVRFSIYIFYDTLLLKQNRK